MMPTLAAMLLAIDVGNTNIVVGVFDGDLEVERHPPRRPIELVVPDARFEAHQWRA